jgi:carbamoyltransferase
MKALLNAKIKKRESFRPFAPSVLKETVSEWFEEDDDVPFMMQLFQIREEKRALIPAVSHVDGSGRLQTVKRSANPLYHALISAFRDLTGVPMVLSTSFNENEPVVCKPQEALDCFLRTNMDALVLGEFVIRRRPTERDAAKDRGAAKATKWAPVGANADRGHRLPAPRQMSPKPRSEHFLVPRLLRRGD